MLYLYKFENILHIKPFLLPKMIFYLFFISVPYRSINLLQSTRGINQNKEAAPLMFTGNNIPEQTLPVLRFFDLATDLSCIIDTYKC